MNEITRAAGAPTITTSTMRAASMLDKPCVGWEQPRLRWEQPRVLWAQHREAALNWLAFGLLLAAWNAADLIDSSGRARRPDALRPYPSVSVRAVMRAGGSSHD